MNDHISKILKRLEDIGLSDRSGALLYSGNETIKKGDWYFLGSNPGGHEEKFEKEQTVKSQLLKSDSTFNEYFDGEWVSKWKEICPPGQQHHQVNIKNLFVDLGVDLKNTLSTNLCFVRSSMENTYKGSRSRDNELCWSIHEHILSVVAPKYILANGSTARNFIKKKILQVNPRALVDEEKKLTENLKCTMTIGSLFLRESGVTLKNIKLFSVPHLGYYTYYPESAGWIRSRVI